MIDVHATADAVRREIASAEVHYRSRRQPKARASAVTGAAKGHTGQRPLLDHCHADMAHDWAEFEALRLSRPYLVRCGGPRIRPLPLEESR